MSNYDLTNKQSENYAKMLIQDVHLAEQNNNNNDEEKASSLPQKHKGNLLLVESETLVKRPPMFNVIMLNDDYTPMDFVVDVLKGVFRMTHEDAVSTMLKIHHNGEANCGTYTRDVAETKMEIAVNMAKNHEYPLQCTIEQA
jgi:ATP-dependent Clp protease adaptor protein ClpS